MGRVLWVAGDSDMAGVARHILDVVAVGLPGWGLEVLAPPGPLVTRLQSAGVTVHTGDFGSQAGVARSIFSLRRLWRRIGPDVTHSHLAWADLVVAFAATGEPRRLVTTEHGIADDPLLYNPRPGVARAKRAAHRWRLGRTAALIAVSRATETAVRRAWKPPSSLRTELIPNGVDRMVDPRSSKPGFRCGILSRLVGEKGLPAALDGFAALHRSNPQSTLLVAGDGPLRSALETRAANLGISNSVEFVGHVDPASFWPQVDVLLQMSHWENCSYTLLDALTRGRGIVASAVGGNPEMLPAQCLVPAGSKPEVIAEHLEVQCGNPDDRPDLPPSWPTRTEMSSRIVSLYDSLLRSRGVSQL